MVELRTLAFHEAWQAVFFTGGFWVFSSLLIFFQSANKLWPGSSCVRLVGCKGTTWKFVVI